MPRVYDQIDLQWSWNGDYLLDDSGDLKSTEDNQIVALEQQISNIVRSVTGDWEFAQFIGADMDDFVGKANTRETAQALHRQLSAAIIRGANVHPNDLKIKIIPITHEAISILIAVNAIPTQNNTLDEEWLRFNYIFTFGVPDISLREVR